MGFPPVSAVDDIESYTTAAPPTVAVQPATLRWHGAATIHRQRIAFKAGEGPAGGNFTARWLRNGVTMGTITVLNGAVAGDIAAPANAALADGDLLTTEVLGISGATGAAELILDVTRP